MTIPEFKAAAAADATVVHRLGTGTALWTDGQPGIGLDDGSVLTLDADYGVRACKSLGEAAAAAAIRALKDIDDPVQTAAALARTAETTDDPEGTVRAIAGDLPKEHWTPTVTTTVNLLEEKGNHTLARRLESAARRQARTSRYNRRRRALRAGRSRRQSTTSPR